MTNVKLYRDGGGKPACFHNHCFPTISDDLTWVEGSDSATSAAGTVTVYAKAKRLYRIDDTGAVRVLGPPAGGTTWEVPTAGCICPTGGCNICHNGITCVTTCVAARCVKTGSIYWGTGDLYVHSGTVMKFTATKGMGPRDNNQYCLGWASLPWCGLWATNQDVASDCNLKKEFTDIVCNDLLECYSKVPIQTWKWKNAKDVSTKEMGFVEGEREYDIICENAIKSQGEPADTNVHIGPFAQDFNQKMSQWFDTDGQSINLMDHNGVHHAILSEISSKLKTIKKEINLLK